MMPTPMLFRYSLNDPMGELRQIQFNHPARHLDEVSNQLPGGVYTTFRTYHKSFALNLDDHIQRLEHSAAEIIGKISIDRDIFRRNLRSVLKQHPAAESRIRVTLVQEDVAGVQIYLAIEELILPNPGLYKSGVSVITTPLMRTKPDVKDTEFIKQTKSLRRLLTNGINEVLMVNQKGEVLEGLSSNFLPYREVR